MTKEELIGKLQMVYVGDINALNELIGYYDGLKLVIEELKQENQELKKQLEEKTKIGISDHKYASKCEDKVITIENQQQEFINYLEDEIKQINPKILDDGELNLRLDDIKYTQYLTYKEILQKYKSIIGDDK